MADWRVLDRPDPSPGNPLMVRDIARQLGEEAGRVSDTVTRLRGIANAVDALQMRGDYAPGYRRVLAELPGELARLEIAYRSVGAALDRFASGLEQAQARAGAALRHGSEAAARYQGALRELRALLPDGQPAGLLGGVHLNPWMLDAATVELDENLRSQARVIAFRARSAQDDVETANRLADQAAGLREDAERRCEREIDAVNLRLRTSPRRSAYLP